MPDAVVLTEAQERALQVLVANQPVTPRQFAKLMWPDSPAWNKVTRKFGGYTGAMGGTMPMNGARVLWRLRDLGYAYKDERGQWRALRSVGRG